MFDINPIDIENDSKKILAVKSGNEQYLRYSEKMKKIHMPKNIPYLWTNYELEKFPPKSTKAEMSKNIFKESKIHQWPLPLDLYLERMGFSIIKEFKDKSIWSNFISKDIGVKLSDNKTETYYNCLKDVYLSNYEIVLEIVHHQEKELIKSGNKFAEHCKTFTEATNQCILNLRMSNQYPQQILFIVSNIIIVYYQLYYLPSFLKTFQTRPKLNDQDNIAYETFKNTLYIARVLFTNRFYDLAPIRHDCHHLIDCLIEMLNELYPKMQKSKMIMEIVEILLDVIGIYYSYDGIYNYPDMKIVQKIYNNQKSTEAMKYFAAKLLCHIGQNEGQVEFLLECRKSTKNPLIQLHFITLMNGIELFLVKILEKKMKGKGAVNQLNNDDYKLMVSTGTCIYMKEIYERFMQLFDSKYKSIIFDNIRTNKNLSRKEKVAVNCLFILFSNISKHMYRQKKDIKDTLYFDYHYYILYLEEFYDYIGQNIVATRIVEIILYSICNIFQVCAITREGYWSALLLKYFQSENSTSEMRLASAVALSYVPYCVKFRPIGDIVSFLINVLASSQKSVSQSLFMGFDKEEILLSLNKHIETWTKCLENGKAVKYKMDKDFLSRLYGWILIINDGFIVCSPSSIIGMTHEIISFFNVHYKSDILHILRNNLNYREEDKLILNCLYVAVNVLGTYMRNNPNYFNDFNDQIFQKAFNDFLDLIDTNVIAQRICESFLYSLCNIAQSQLCTIDAGFWIPKLKQCYQNERNSKEIKLASCVVIGHIAEISGEFHFDILIYLLNNMKYFSMAYERYLGFLSEEIIMSSTNMILILSKKTEEYFKNDACNMDTLQNLNKVLCCINDNETIKDFDYQSCLNLFLCKMMKTFSFYMKQCILETFTTNKMLNDKDKIIINCFCNSFTVYGRYIVEKPNEILIGQDCEIILTHLKDIQPFIQKNIVAARITEIILYSLCNIVKVTTIIVNTSLWNTILWDLFVQQSFSEEIRLASAVALANIINTEDNGKITDIDILIKYLEDIYKEMIIQSNNNYLGFSMEEIGNSCKKIQNTISKS